MSNNLSVPVTMKSFQALGTTVSPNITVCVRGRHAVGKSEGVYQIARQIRHDYYKSKEWEDIKKAAKAGKTNLPHELMNHNYEDGLPVIERRLSQITEGDIVGLPEFQLNERTGVPSTMFRPCDWLLLATEFPVMLFLDERNRALEAVKQSVFQLTDSKAYYGNKLHADTRIIVAENIGDSYQVQTCDPAEVSRCFTVTLEPTIEEWISYASTICHPMFIEFIRDNQNLIEHTGTFEPNKKYPDRRSWVRLDAEMRNAGVYDKPGDILYVLACSAVGIEAGQRFTEFVRNYDREIPVEEIIKDWSKAKKRIQGGNDHITNEQFISIGEKIGDYADRNKLSDDEAMEIAKFLKDCPPEPRMNTYYRFTKNINNDSSNLFKIHPIVKDLIVKTANGEDTSEVKLNAPSKASKK